MELVDYYLRKNLLGNGSWGYPECINSEINFSKVPSCSSTFTEICVNGMNFGIMLCKELCKQGKNL